MPGFTSDDIIWAEVSGFSRISGKNRSGSSANSKLVIGLNSLRDEH